MPFEQIQSFNTLWAFATAISEDDEYAAICDNRGLIFGRLEDIGSGRRRFVLLKRHAILGTSLVFRKTSKTDETPERTLLFCGSAQGDLLEFEIIADELISRHVWRGRHTNRVHGLAVCGDYVATASHDERVRVSSLAARSELALYYHADWAWAVCFSGDGRWLASGSKDQCVFVVDARDAFQRRATLRLAAPVLSVRFSPDDSMLAVGAWSGRSAIYAVASFEPLRALAGALHVLCVRWCRNASLLGAADHGTLVVWRAATGAVASVAQVHRKTVYAVSLTRSLRTALTGANTPSAGSEHYHGRETRAASCVLTASNLVGDSSATAALYCAALRVARFRATPFGFIPMQRIAEWLAAAEAGADILTPLTEDERTRIFAAALLACKEREERIAFVRSLGGFHERMYWLRLHHTV